MSLEFFNVIDDKKTLHSIDDPDLAILDDEIFSIFNQRYDNLIDLYSDFRLHGNHLEYLEELLKTKSQKSIAAKKLYDFIDYCLKNEITLKVRGD